MVFFRHKKQKEEDIAVCVCRYDANDPESACGGSCLNVLTSTECTPGYCPCGNFCKNQVNDHSFIIHIWHIFHIILCCTRSLRKWIIEILSCNFTFKLVSWLWQKFQKCEYAKLQLFKTEGRGWGLLAAEDIKVRLT